MMPITLHRRAPLAIILALTLFSPLSPAQGDGMLSVEMLYHPKLRRPLVDVPRTQLAWLSDGVLQELKINRQARRVELARVDPKTGKSEPLLDSAKIEEALEKAGAPPSAKMALQQAAQGGITWNDQRSAFVFAVDDDLFFVDLTAGVARRLTKEKGSEDEVTFSPDGSAVAFLRGSDLYVSRVADGVETALTTGGTDKVLHGRLDWVYQEEVYGRGNWKGFWWAPDSKSIAWLDLDETKVPEFTVIDHRPLHQDLHRVAYPKVGDPNPVVRLGVVPVTGGPTKYVTDPHAGEEILIVNVGFAPDGRLQAEWQNRAQTWLELLTFDSDLKATVTLRETTKAWVERLPMPAWQKDGSFLWESDRDGWHHVYHYDAAGKLLNAVTQGAWDVKEVHGVDQAHGVMYFSATERSPITVDVYRVGLDGKGQQRLTAEPGTHTQVRFSPDFTYFVEQWSDVNTPPNQTLRDGAGAIVRVIDENPSPAWKAIKKGKVSFQQVPTRDGFAMETMLMLPPDFDESKKYPVLQFIYGGPSAPQVHNAFSRNLLFHHLMCQQGYIVWYCDNRSASGKGWGSAWGIYKNMGEQELADQLDGLAWLKEKPWVDGSRIGIWGWSYGGYMTTYALTHCDAYKCGLAGGPVTDWRLYDSIYTERYMGLLGENKAGYDKSSVQLAAANLSGKLLLMHGTLDDNVHPQNTFQLMDRLQDAGKTFELMLLPGSDHSPRTLPHMYAQHRAMYDFVKRSL